MSLDTSYADSPLEMCALFARHFSIVFAEPVVSPNLLRPDMSYTPENVVCVDSVAVDVELVACTLHKLKPSLTPGPDGLPGVTLKNCADVLAPPLAMLFVMSLSSGVFPDIWKSVWLVPIF